MRYRLRQEAQVAIVEAKEEKRMMNKRAKTFQCPVMITPLTGQKIFDRDHLAAVRTEVAALRAHQGLIVQAQGM